MSLYSNTTGNDNVAMGYTSMRQKTSGAGNVALGLRYAEFVVPLVKAIQEQQQIIAELKKRIEVLENKK
jgi:hypothetical protein